MFDNILEIFEELNRRLKSEEIELTIICVGGFVLSYYGVRITHDIYGFFNTNNLIDNIIESIGEQFNINEADEIWLNNSVENMNDAPDESICTVVYKYSHLKVLIPPLIYVAGMKLMSARERDIKDVGAIIHKEKISNPDELIQELAKYGFKNIDESLILESFGYAYGIDWLEAYFINNEDSLFFDISLNANNYLRDEKK